jgi:protocatechuate 3,4-dioxygenase, alpha subunit
MTDATAGLTPSQTAGPYLEIGLLRDIVTPLGIDAGDPRAIVLSGVLLDGAGEPVLDGMIEAWFANEHGRYAHPGDDRDELPLEAGFRGFARSGTVDGGRYALVVLKPGPVPWPDGGLQAPHLVIGVFARGLLKRLVTRMYFPDEMEANAADPVLTRLDDRQRETLVANADGDGLRFDIVLQGSGQTTFFAV